METIKRAFACEVKEIDEQERSIWFIASTEDQDRVGDIIRVAGWKFDAYDRNPVFLWAHDSGELPIGKCVARQIDGVRLLMKIQFATVEENPLADQVYRLYKGGYLNAVSVGFKPLKRMPIHPEDKWGDMGWEFVEQELLELSAVPVPANSSALQLMMKGMDANEEAKRDIGSAEDYTVYITFTKAEFDGLNKYGENPSDWLSNLESLKDLVDHMKAEMEAEEKGALIKGRKKLEAIAKQLTGEYKEFASACDDVVEKCHGTLRKVLDEILPHEEPEEPMMPKALDVMDIIAALPSPEPKEFDLEAFIAEIRRDLAR